MNNARVSLCCLGLILGFLYIGAPRALHAEPDVEGSIEDAAFRRLPGYHIIEFAANDDAIDCNISSEKQMIIDGRRIFFNYEIDDGATVSDEQEIMRFYAAIARRQGGQTVFMGVTSAGYNTATFKMAGRSGEKWVLVTPFEDGAGYFLNIIDRRPVNKNKAMGE